MSGETEFAMPVGVEMKPKLAIPRFYTEMVEQTFRSQQEGRPIYAEREMVEIIIPGDRNTRATEIVNDEHKKRWPMEYAGFKRGEEVPVEGTPLRDWPAAEHRAREGELAYFNILTVEQLSQVNDSQLQNLGMGARRERDAALKFLEVAEKGTGPLMRLLDRAERAEQEVALA